MREKDSGFLDKQIIKCANYLQCVLRYGLPFITVYSALNYALFRLGAGNSKLDYPWRAVILPNIAFMFLVSFLWWLLMRQLAIWKKKLQSGPRPDGPGIEKF